MKPCATSSDPVYSRETSRPDIFYAVCSCKLRPKQVEESKERLFRDLSLTSLIVWHPACASTGPGCSVLIPQTVMLAVVIAPDNHLDPAPLTDCCIPRVDLTGTPRLPGLFVRVPVA